MEVWGSEEGLEKAHDERSNKREKAKRKKFDKKVKGQVWMIEAHVLKRDGLDTYIKKLNWYNLIFFFTELRLAVRSSLVRVSSGPHEHEYGPETYDEETDTYSVSCECGHVRNYEKMWWKSGSVKDRIYIRGMSGITKKCGGNIGIQYACDGKAETYKIMVSEKQKH